MLSTQSVVSREFLGLQQPEFFHCDYYCDDPAPRGRKGSGGGERRERRDEMNGK